jgi:hypothetical protein
MLIVLRDFAMNIRVVAYYGPVWSTATFHHATDFAVTFHRITV